MNIQYLRTSGTGTNSIVKVISSGLAIASILGATTTRRLNYKKLCKRSLEAGKSLTAWCSTRN